MSDIFYLIFSFLIFVVLQGLLINGIHYCFQGGCTKDMNKGLLCDGNVFYKISPKFFEKHKGKTWTKPFWGCIKCMASVHGTWTFWITALLIFDYNWCMFIVWIFDLFILVSVNWLIYQKL